MANLKSLTKAELVAKAKKEFGLELKMSALKADMIKSIEDAEKKAPKAKTGKRHSGEY